jgi:protein arginine kinase activator
MKCQFCAKAATIHITELSEGDVSEAHLCEFHAREYLTNKEQAEKAQGPTDPAQQKIQAAAAGLEPDELARADKKSCPMCGMTFREFRSAGRLGCPHDYRCFEEQLVPLVQGIHGEVEHTGKRSSRGAGASRQRSELVRLRRQMREAIAREQYERASDLRDRIRGIEQPKPPAEAGPDE